MQISKYILQKYDPDLLRTEFQNSIPAPMIVLDNFLPEQIALTLSKELDSIEKEHCKHFSRNHSYMEECNDLDFMPEASVLIAELHSQKFLNWLNDITGIQNLIPDPYLIGAGYSRSFRGDSLKKHVDFNWNDSLKLYRALTLIVYINENWEKEWGGHLEFCGFDDSIINVVDIKWNRAVIWKHHEHCFHGYPEPINCPQETCRKTIRLFYYTSNQEPLDSNPPHRSLYWFDENTKTPIDINIYK